MQCRDSKWRRLQRKIGKASDFGGRGGVFGASGGGLKWFKE